MLNLRKHQLKMLSIVNAIIDGAPTRKILIYAVPGAGKSAIPLIAGKLISHGMVDKICWICPRTALQDQAERNFLDLGFRDILGHQLTIRTSTNDIDPCRGLDGFVTTYQALSVSKNSAVLDDFKARRYILIIDENHHAEESSLWHKILNPLVDHAKYLILMTGTLERGNDSRIAFVDYANSRPIMTDTVETKVIQYYRVDALRERAILPIEFTLFDGSVEWEKDGERKEGTLSRRIDDAGQALFTALNTEFADNLLERGLSHWVAYKANNPRSKLLVVTANYDHAKRHVKKLKSIGLRAKIATSHESAQALKNIREFKLGDLEALVAICIPYEGIDVPPLTHVILLTRIRSTPWIHQCISRAVRVDPQAGPYETQKAYIFAPDDFLFRQVVERIKSEQLAVIQAAKEGAGGVGNGGGGIREDVIPLGSELTGERSVYLGGRAMSNYPAFLEPPSVVESGLHEKISMHVRDFCYKNFYNDKRINSEIKLAFGGKARGHMTTGELEAVLVHVQRVYPLEGRTEVDGVSKTRGPGRRPSPAEDIRNPEQLAFLFGDGSPIGPLW